MAMDRRAVTLKPDVVSPEPAAPEPLPDALVRLSSAVGNRAMGQLLQRTRAFADAQDQAAHERRERGNERRQAYAGTTADDRERLGEAMASERDRVIIERQGPELADRKLILDELARFNAASPSMEDPAVGSFSRLRSALWAMGVALAEERERTPADIQLMLGIIGAATAVQTAGAGYGRLRQLQADWEPLWIELFNLTGWQKGKNVLEVPKDNPGAIPTSRPLTGGERLAAGAVKALTANTGFAFQLVGVEASMKKTSTAILKELDLVEGESQAELITDLKLRLGKLSGRIPAAKAVDAILDVISSLRKSGGYEAAELRKIRAKHEWALENDWAEIGMGHGHATPMPGAVTGPATKRNAPSSSSAPTSSSSAPARRK